MNLTTIANRARRAVPRSECFGPVLATAGIRIHLSGRAFDYQTLRAMAYATFGGAEPGEVLATVERIADGDAEDWHAEWRRTVELVDRQDDGTDGDRNGRTARFASFRAHTYGRTDEGLPGKLQEALLFRKNTFAVFYGGSMAKGESKRSSPGGRTPTFSST